MVDETALRVADAISQMRSKAAGFYGPLAELEDALRDYADNATGWARASLLSMLQERGQSLAEAGKATSLLASRLLELHRRLKEG